MAELASIITKIIFLMILIRIAFLDLRNQRIYNRDIMIIVWLSQIGMYTIPEIPVLSKLTGVIGISIPMLLIAIIRRGAFGGGDIKLMAAGGLFLGWEKILSAVVLAVFSAGIYCCYLLFVKKAGRKAVFPLGPFLCFGMAMALVM